MTLGDRRTTGREALSARIAADVAAFEAAGGVIERPASGSTVDDGGDPLRKRTDSGCSWLFGPAKPDSLRSDVFAGLRGRKRLGPEVRT